MNKEQKLARLSNNILVALGLDTSKYAVNYGVTSESKTVINIRDSKGVAIYKVEIPNGYKQDATGNCGIRSIREITNTYVTDCTRPSKDEWGRTIHRRIYNPQAIGAACAYSLISLEPREFIHYLSFACYMKKYMYHCYAIAFFCMLDNLISIGEVIHIPPLNLNPGYIQGDQHGTLIALWYPRKEYVFAKGKTFGIRGRDLWEDSRVLKKETTSLPQVITKKFIKSVSGIQYKADR